MPSARCVMLYVEGTKKAMRHYTKLLMHRIRWNETVDGETGETGETGDNGCTQLWSGVVKQPHFTEFAMIDCDSDLEARKEMEAKSLVQHWDAVVHYVPQMRQI